MKARKIKVVCAWCGRFLRGTKNCQDVSHGICPTCMWQTVGIVTEESHDPWVEWQDEGSEG